jgi:hypothetical protein
MGATHQTQLPSRQFWTMSTWQKNGCFPNSYQLAVCQNLVPLVNIKIAGKWMFIPLKMVLIGIDPYPTPKSTKIAIEPRSPQMNLQQRISRWSRRGKTANSCLFVAGSRTCHVAGNSQAQSACGDLRPCMGLSENLRETSQKLTV